MTPNLCPDQQPENHSCRPWAESVSSRSLSGAGAAQPVWHRDQLLSRTSRAALAALGLILLVLLATAALLTPAEEGFGTHRQLGLPDCTFVAMFGIRCPSCGMTTSWAHLTRGQVASAMQANAGGTLLGALAMLLAPWSLLAAAKGRCPGGVPTQTRVFVVSLVVASVTVLDWALRMLFAAG